MKSAVRPVALVLLFAALASVLAACGSASDIGWAKFKLPDGYTVVDKMSNYFTISKSKDTDINSFKIEDSTIRVGLKLREPGTRFPDAETFVSGLLADESGRYADQGMLEAGGLKYHLVSSAFDEGTTHQDYTDGYADFNDKWSVQFNGYLIRYDDPVLAEFLSTLEFNTAKFPC